MQVVNLLGARQQPSLFGIRRVEADAVATHGVTVLDVNQLAGQQFVAVGQGLFEAGGGECALQPVVQHGFLTGIVQAQQISQTRQRRARVSQVGCWRGVKGQLGGRCVVGEGPQQVQTADFECAEPFAQRAFQRAFPAWLDVQPTPQAGQVIEPVFF